MSSFSGIVTINQGDRLHKGIGFVNVVSYVIYPIPFAVQVSFEPPARSL